jgi:hypothetical protein
MIITTIHGDMDDSLLEKTEGAIENDNEKTTWVEYRLKGQPPPRVAKGICLDCLDQICKHVHRSVGIELKTGIFGEGSVSGFA